MSMRLTETLKHLLWQTYFYCPRPLAKYLYSLGRSAFIADGRDPYFQQAFKRASLSGLQGDYLEFGVYKGDSFITACNLAVRYKIVNMRFFAFDCFEGVPDSEGWVKKGAYACSEELFKKIISQAGVDMNRTVIVKGMYNDTLNEATKTKHHLSKAAIVHIDCDLYLSTGEVLKFIESLCGDGTVIIFDDWYIYGPDNVFAMGEGKAFSEWHLRQYCHDLFDFPGRSKGFVFSRRRSANR